MSVIRWEDPGPSQQGGKGVNKALIAHELVAVQLRRRPQEWGVIHEARGLNNIATDIKRGKLRAYRPAGSYEACTRVQNDMLITFARYVGAGTATSYSQRRSWPVPKRSRSGATRPPSTRRSSRPTTTGSASRSPCRSARSTTPTSPTTPATSGRSDCVTEHPRQHHDRSRVMAELILPSGHVALVDDADLADVLAAGPWRVTRDRHVWYVRRGQVRIQTRQGVGRIRKTQLPARLRLRGSAFQIRRPPRTAGPDGGP
jgi:hypothetical protein